MVKLSKSTPTCHRDFFAITWRQDMFASWRTSIEPLRRLSNSNDMRSAMLKMPFGALAAATLLIQVAAFSSATPVKADEAPQAVIEKGMERAAAAEATGPQAITDIAGTFRVDGKIRKKTNSLTTCNCYVYFYHDNLEGGDYYTYGQRNISGKTCKMNLPFRFPKGDTGRPVVVSMSANCSGDKIYRSYSADLNDIPLKNGDSKVVKFDIDM